jgi:Cu/Ag efflux pump CusA
VRWLERLYRPTLAFALKTPGPVHAAALLILTDGGVCYFFLGSEFLC